MSVLRVLLTVIKDEPVLGLFIGVLLVKYWRSVIKVLLGLILGVFLVGMAVTLIP
ncbi:MAG TPA: hypothetical protein VFG33_33835 [Kribbella sp.]|uniref:hypothetical protein n=1 Tax=Kribbella sp. TaxID=1871183 RepID=UPI002D76E5B1|nr:hypothetical protein [Kribbella sp.]HET6298406.1 hypothetical protein [Kribbella sp.]